MSTFENASNTVSRFSQVTVEDVSSYQPTVISWPFHNTVASVHRLEYRLFQNSIKASVCCAAGTRSALEVLRLYLGCMRICALQIDIYHYHLPLPSYAQYGT